MNIMSQLENKIILMYIGVAGIRSEDIEDFIQKITRRIAPSTVNGEIIVIPTQTTDTRIECINPIYITEEELVKKHTDLMKELHEELEHQIKQLKDEQ
jgi:hypothetical protein